MSLTSINVAARERGDKSAMTDAELVARYDGRVPRYTSYPTAPHFTPAVGAATYAAWLHPPQADALGGGDGGRRLPQHQPGEDMPGALATGGRVADGRGSGGGHGGAPEMHKSIVLAF